MKQIFIAQIGFGKILRWLGSTADTPVQNRDENLRISYIRTFQKIICASCKYLS